MNINKKFEFIGLMFIKQQDDINVHFLSFDFYYLETRFPKEFPSITDIKAVRYVEGSVSDLFLNGIRFEKINVKIK